MGGQFSLWVDDEALPIEDQFTPPPGFASLTALVGNTTMALIEDGEVLGSRQLNMGNSSQAPLNDSMDTEEKDLVDYASVIRAMIRHENDVTNNRLTWMLVLQGFLLVASASFWKIYWLPFVAIATLGILTSVSVYYSCWLSGFPHVQQRGR